MPVCFRLYPKGKDEPLAEKLQDVDSKMRAYFNQPPSETEYLGDWYASIGLRLALGKSFQQIKEEFIGLQDEPFYVVALQIVNWLDEHYTSDTWRSV